jgi:hypothetical protein
MCLDRVGKTATLKKERTVWKTARVIFYSSNDCHLCTGDRKFPLLKGLNKAETARMLPSNHGSYQAGFHCCVTRRGACRWASGDDHWIIKLTIPAGTAVLHGHQEVIGKVIVSPVICISEGEYTRVINLASKEAQDEAHCNSET